MSELARDSAAGGLLRGRLTSTSDSRGITIVSVEELLRGLLAQIAGARDNDRLIVTYARLQKAVLGLTQLTVLAWNDAAAQAFEKLRKERLNIGTMDLRIASIVIANSATLLSRSLKDFERVPELKAEDWLS